MRPKDVHDAKKILGTHFVKQSASISSVLTYDTVKVLF